MGKGSGICERPAMDPGAAQELFSCKLYRSGALEKVSDYGPAQASFDIADNLKPAGRTGRKEGLFCVPSLPEVAKWFRANLDLQSHGYTPDTYELSYQGPEPYIYPVRLWGSGRETSQHHRYWEAGVKLSEYLANPPQDHIWGDGGEVMADPKYLVKSKKLSVKRLILAAEPWRAEELESLLWRSRWGKGKTLRDYKQEGAPLRVKNA